MVIRKNIADLVCREMHRKERRKVLLSSMTDAYQPSDAHYELTRKIIECLLKGGFPLTVLTKSPLVLRDLDLLKQFSSAEVTFSISSLDKDVYSVFEPRAPSPEARLKALERILDSGVRGSLFMAPHLPAKGSFEEQYLPAFRAAKELGLRTIYMDTLNYGGPLKKTIMETYLRGYPNGLESYRALLTSPPSYNERLKATTINLGRSLDLDVVFV